MEGFEIKEPQDLVGILHGSLLASVSRLDWKKWRMRQAEGWEGGHGQKSRQEAGSRQGLDHHVGSGGGDGCWGRVPCCQVQLSVRWLGGSLFFEQSILSVIR